MNFPTQLTTTTSGATKLAGMRPLLHGNQVLISRKQVARILGNVSIATIKRLEAQGRLRAVRLRERGNVYFRYDDIETFLLSTRGNA